MSVMWSRSIQEVKEVLDMEGRHKMGIEGESGRNETRVEHVKYCVSTWLLFTSEIVIGIPIIEVTSISDPIADVC